MAAAQPISVTMPDGTVQNFNSLRQACVHFGVPLKRVHKRLKYFGWTAEEALEVVPHTQRNRPITVTMGDGTPRIFESLRQAAHALGVPYLIAYKRLDREWTPEQAFGIEPPPKRESPAAKQIDLTANGINFSWPSLAQAAKANGLTRSQVRGRLDGGWTLPQALGLEDSGRPPHKIEVSVSDKGTIKTFESLTEAATNYQLSVDLVLQRLRKLKWSIEEALGIEPRPGYADRCYGLIYVITHTASGRQYVGQTKETTVGKRWELHVQEALKNTKKTTRPLVKAIQDYGRDAFTFTHLDDATSQAELNTKEVIWIDYLDTRLPKGFNATRGGQGLESGQSVVVDGIRFRTLTAACEHFGVPISSASRWLKKGTPEQAFGLTPKPKRKSSRGNVLEFKHDGTKHRYPSLAAAADAYGVNESNLQRRLKDGWSIQEALELVERPGAKQNKPVQVKIDGKTVTYHSRGAAAKAHGLTVNTFLDRLRRGWPIKRALLTPAGNQGRRSLASRPSSSRN